MSFDPRTAIIHNSPDTSGWAVTSRFDHVSFFGHTISVGHSKLGQWPAVPYITTTQEATIWVAFQIGGQWHATGGERLRPGQDTKDLTQPADIGPGWLYDPNRWGVMAHYIPQPGELVGFMIAAGDTRGDGNIAVRERTDWVLVKFPTAGAGMAEIVWREGAGVPVPVPTPTPTPVPTPVPDARLDRVIDLLETLEARIDILDSDLDDIRGAISDIAGRPHPRYRGRVVPFGNTTLFPEENS